MSTNKAGLSRSAAHPLFVMISGQKRIMDKTIVPLNPVKKHEPEAYIQGGCGRGMRTFATGHSRLGATAG